MTGLHLFQAFRGFRALRGERGAVAVEAAFVYPAILMAFFAVIELAHMAITIAAGQSALSSALTDFRAEGTLGTMPEMEIRHGMAADSFGYLKPENVTRVTVEPYASLDEMGGGSGEDDESSDEDAGSDSATSGRYPAWHIVVTISKDFITPIPRLLITNRKDFTFRYERVLAYLPQEDEE